MTPERLNALSTQRLLAYRKALLSLEESADQSDLDEAGIAALDPVFIHFKDDPRWTEVFETVKKLLAGRELR